MQSQFLLLLVLSALAAPALSSLQCPSLAAEVICADAEPGFRYSDGCNGVTCSGYGRYETTMMWCPRPTTAEQRRQCRQNLAEVVDSLGPLTCPNLQAERICRGRAEGFQYNDGCNGVTCTDGDFAATMMFCPRGDPEGVYCRLKEDQLDQANDKRRRRRR